MAEILSLSDAVARIPWDSTLAFGGMTLYRRPVALVREILRHRAALLRPPDLFKLATLTCAFESDLLVGAGAVATVQTCYFGMEIFGLAPMFTANADRIRIIEESEASICAGYLTALGENPPKLPGRDEPWKPIEIDVALIHALEADPLGRVRFEGNLACDREIAGLAKLTIVSAERIVKKLEDSQKDIIADVVCHAPGGAWPTSCYPDYTYDGLELLHYVRTCRAGKFQEYLDGFLTR